jgi:hypothetical protein
VKRTLHDFLAKEVLFEHLLAIHRHYLGSGGYDRNTMVARVTQFFESPEGRVRLAQGLAREEIELLHLLRLVGGIAPRKWLFRELAGRSTLSAEDWKRIAWGLRRRHLVFQIGSDTAYFPEGISDLMAPVVSEPPPRLEGDVVPGPSALRQSVHGLVIALVNAVHQDCPRVMAEDDRIWKRDLQGMADFFHSYLFEPNSTGEGSIRLIRGRISRLVELVRRMGFFEKRGKRLHVNRENWADWTRRSEVERSSLFLSFLKDHYEHIPVALEALVDWRESSWVPLDRLTEAVRYRSLRTSFHVLRVRPQADVAGEGPGRGWVSACVHLLADLGLVYTGSDSRGEPVARATEGAIEAWGLLHGARPTTRRRSREKTEPRVYAQPNFELLVPEDVPPPVHREIGEIARLKSLDRFWTYALTSESVARGVEEGLTAREIVERLDRFAQGAVPGNVRDAVNGWARTAWWASTNGGRVVLKAEADFFESIQRLDGWEARFERVDHSLAPIVSRHDASHWLEERGVRVATEEQELAGEPGRSPRDDYHRAVDAWTRRTVHGGDGPPTGSTWDDAIPVEPLPESRGRTSAPGTGATEH